MLQITYNDFECIDKALGLEVGGVYPHSDIGVEVTLTRRGDNKIVKSYWDGLRGEERDQRMENHGMTGKRHSKDTRKKMSKSMTGIKKPTLHKGGTLQKDGVVVSFECISQFAREYGLSNSHICELLKGKRKSVKGWTNVV